jgi:hypothetical protein
VFRVKGEQILLGRKQPGKASQRVAFSFRPGFVCPRVVEIDKLARHRPAAVVFSHEIMGSFGLTSDAGWYLRAAS